MEAIKCNRPRILCSVSHVVNQGSLPTNSPLAYPITFNCIFFSLFSLFFLLLLFFFLQVLASIALNYSHNRNQFFRKITSGEMKWRQQSKACAITRPELRLVSSQDNTRTDNREPPPTLPLPTII